VPGSKHVTAAHLTFVVPRRAQSTSALSTVRAVCHNSGRA
jgi:hypothetical protein